MMKTLATGVIRDAGRLFRSTRLARVGWVNRLHGEIVLRMHGSDTAEVGPYRVRFDRRDKLIAKKLILYNEFEKNEIDLIRNVVRPGDCAVDIGANIGIHTLFLSECVGDDGQVIAVEPDPDNAALLRENIANNNCNNVRVLQCALGNTEGSAMLYQHPTNRGNLSLAELEAGREGVPVAVHRANDVLQRLGVRPDFAKIDIEGGEPEAIAGLGSLKPPNLLFEFYPPYIRTFGQDPRSFLQGLEEEGYALSVVTDGGEVLQASSREILSLCEKRWKEINLFARRLTQTAHAAVLSMLALLSTLDALVSPAVNFSDTFF